MLKLFGGIRNLKTNIAQIALSFLLFPILMCICNIFSSATSNSASLGMLLSMFNEVPICGMAFDIISQYVTFGAEVKLSEITILLFLKAFPETIMVSVIVHFFCQLFQREWSIFNLTLTDEPVFSPLPIFPTFLGLVVSTVIVGLLNLFKNEMITIFSEILLIAIIIFAIKLMFGKKFDNGILGLKKILTFIIDGLYAVIFSTYVAAMVIVGSGTVQGFKETIVFVITMVAVVFVATILVFFVRKGCKNLV